MAIDDSGSGDVPDDSRDRDEDAPPPDREPTVMELMNAPARPSESRRKTVLWFCLAFVTGMLALTFAVISSSGFDFLTVLTVVILGFIDAAMIGALRYKGEDPMAQFDPPDRKPPRRFWRRRR